jgi:phage tail-like protein
MNNLDYLYNNLPSRFRRDDKDLFLKRFLQFSGETLDDYDYFFETFFEQINPETARIDFVEFWLKELFGWSWFPKWFQNAAKRQLYGHFARHLARRGTATGIELFLADFYITAQVHKSLLFYGEFFVGEQIVCVGEPLILIIEIGKIAPPNYREDIYFCGESFCGEAFYGTFEPLYTQTEIENLLRYQQPQAQEMIIYRRYLSGENNE